MSQPGEGHWPHCPRAQLSALIARTEPAFLGINLLLLLVVVFLPFPTRLVAEALHGSVRVPASPAQWAMLPGWQGCQYARGRPAVRAFDLVGLHSGP